MHMDVLPRISRNVSTPLLALQSSCALSFPKMSFRTSVVVWLWKEFLKSYISTNHFSFVSSIVTDRMKPISIISFRDHVQQMHSEQDRGFESEYQVLNSYHKQIYDILTATICFYFQSLGSEPVASHEVSKLPFNRMKNRFANIFPCKYLISCMLFKCMP